MRLDQIAHTCGRGTRRGLEGCEVDRLTGRIKHAERAVVRADERERALKHKRRDLAEVRARVQSVGDVEERLRAMRLALLVRVEPRVLIADRDLARDGLQERDLLVEPLTRR